MAKNKKNKNQESNELFESSEALASQLTKGEQFLEKNRKTLFIVGGIIAIIFIAFFLFKYYKDNQEQQAQVEMFQAQYYFEQDSLDKALNGDGNNLGFLDIIEDYSVTEAANLANYYAGAIYLQQGDYESAIEYLNKFSSNDLLVQARAYSLIGDAYMELGNYADAAENYNKAADYKSNEFFTPQYLAKAAVAYEKMNDYQAAINAYDKIIDEYENSTEFQSAKKYKARLQGLSQKAD